MVEMGMVGYGEGSSRQEGSLYPVSEWMALCFCFFIVCCSSMIRVVGGSLELDELDSGLCSGCNELILGDAHRLECLISTEVALYGLAVCARLEHALERDRVEVFILGICVLFGLWGGCW